MEIFKLFGSIFVDTDEAEKSISKTEEKTESFASKLGKGVQTAAKWGAGIATATTAAAGAVVGLAANSASAADEVDKMSQKIGLSAEGYQEWSYIMGQNGMEVDKMQVGMKSLRSAMDNMQDVTSGASKNLNDAGQALADLGISVTDSDGKLRDQEEVMKEAMSALADMENGTEKARKASLIFGKAGLEMMPMLNQGSKAITDLKDRAHELGLVMTDEAVTSGVQLGDLMDDIKDSVGMLATNLGTTLFPILIQVCELIIANMPAIQALFESLAPVASQLLTEMLPPLIELASTVLPPLIDLIQQLMPTIIEIASGILPVFSQLLQTLLPAFAEIAQAILPVFVQILGALMPLLQALSPLMQPLLNIVVTLIEPIAKLISTILPPLIELLTNMLNEVIPPLAKQIEFITGLVSEGLASAFETIQPVIDNAIGIFQGLIEFIQGVFTGDWEKAWDGVIKIFDNLFGGIVNIVKMPLNAIISGINGIFSKIGTIVIPDWVPLIGGNKFSLPQLPMLEKGGEILAAGSAIVGEKGPEILDLPQGARVRPLGYGGIEKDDLHEVIYSAFSKALEVVGIKMDVAVIPDESGIFESVRLSNDRYKKTAGGVGAF